MKDTRRLLREFCPPQSYHGKPPPNPTRSRNHQHRPTTKRHERGALPVNPAIRAASVEPHPPKPPNPRLDRGKALRRDRNADEALSPHPLIDAGGSERRLLRSSLYPADDCLSLAPRNEPARVALRAGIARPLVGMPGVVVVDFSPARTVQWSMRAHPSADPIATPHRGPRRRDAHSGCLGCPARHNAPRPCRGGGATAPHEHHRRAECPRPPPPPAPHYNPGSKSRSTQ